MPSSAVDARLGRSRPGGRSGKRKWILSVIAFGLVTAGVTQMMPTPALSEQLLQSLIRSNSMRAKGFPRWFSLLCEVAGPARSRTSGGRN